MKTSLNVGDRVAYSAKFLRSICDYSHDSASMRGTVTKLTSYGHSCMIAGIKWDNDNDELRAGANVANLVRVANIAAESVS
jgi:hypothetical protein